jgi:phosphoribosylamine--glycine ligase
MTAGGYPDGYRTGDAISGLDVAARLPGKVFHAGTRYAGSSNAGSPNAGSPNAGSPIVTAGGRVLCAVGLGNTVSDAQRQAYDLVHAIHWDLVQYRRDIGYRAVDREQRT